MKKCAIITNGYYTNDAIEHQVYSILRELEELGVKVELKKGNELVCYLGEGSIRNSIQGLDFAVFLDKDIHLARMLEKSGVRLFNTASAIEVCDDKALTCIALASKVKMPVTITSPIMYGNVDGEDFIEKIEQKISYPIVVKKCYGSMGAGVFLARNRAELSALREQFKMIPHVYQQFIGKGGEDKRVILVGGEIVASMKRVNENDFRSNIEHGGKGYVTELSEQEKVMATTVASELGLDYCGVDILCGDDGPYFCEANSNAFFRGIEAVTGVNVASAYARRIYGEVYGKNNIK